MTKKKRTPGTVRVVIILFALLAQILLLFYLVNLLRQNTVYLYFLLELVGALAVTLIITKNRNSSYAIVWLIVMMVMPVFGYVLFLLWGNTGSVHRKIREMHENIAYGQGFLHQDSLVASDFLQKHPHRQRICRYLRNSGFPIYGHTQGSYYPTGELLFNKLIDDLAQAQKYIFMEYFIVAEGLLWDRIHSVLQDKARQGVEIRVLYDDIGSCTKIPDSLVAELRSEGIQVLRFNPAEANIFRLLINHRNHRKITVVDGQIGYTGGPNIADEYANLISRLGHWKDTAVRLEGEAVWSLAVNFLQLWDAEAGRQSDYQSYRSLLQVDGSGFYQPFADSPVNNPHNPAEETYVQIISEARQYVYITTPYLVIDSLMKDTLCMAARGGIDVRIVAPKMWDHWYVHKVTQSNYECLLASGVRIFEYAPGFIHAKVILSDDDNAVIGTINMDYRSFFLDFENGVWICGAPVLQNMKNDLLDIFAVSEEIDLESWRNRPKLTKLTQSVLRIFAPLF